MWTYLEIGLLQVEAVKMRSYWSGVGLQPNPTDVLIKGGNLETGWHIGRMVYEDWGNAAKSQGMTKSQERGLEQIFS